MAIHLASTQPPGDLPIAAVITDRSGSVLSQSSNSVVSTGDVTAHAELVAIRGLEFAQLKGNARDLTIAVTLEPCPMCSWAIRSAGIGSVVFGAYNDQYGAAGSVFDFLRDTSSGSTIAVAGGVLEMECSLLLRKAFTEIRNNNSW